MDKTSPAKIPIPPKEGVLWVWERRSPGSSHRFFDLAMRMMGGITTYVSANAVKIVSRISFTYMSRVYLVMGHYYPKINGLRAMCLVEKGKILYLVTMFYVFLIPNQFLIIKTSEIMFGLNHFISLLCCCKHFNITLISNLKETITDN